MITKTARFFMHVFFVVSLFANASIANDTVVKIGVLLPLTGPLKSEAQVNLDGHQFAVDEINSLGGIRSLGGAKLKLIIGDTHGDPTISSKVAGRLIDEGVALLTGSYQSNTTYTSSEVAENHNVPFLISTALSDILTKRGFKYVFRVEPNLSQFVEAQYRFIEDYNLLGDNKVGRIALLYERTLWGQSSAQLQRSYAYKKGYNIVADIAYPNNLEKSSGAADNVALQISRASPDIILQSSYLNDSVHLTRALKLAGVHPKAIIGTGAGSKDPKFITALGSDGEYWMVVNEWSPDMKRRGMSDLNERFKKRYGYNMNGIGAVCYSVIWIAKEALEVSKSVDGARLRDAIASLNIDYGPATILPRGRVFFDGEGNNVALPIVTQIIDSDNKMVWPREIASTPPVFGRYFTKR